MNPPPQKKKNLDILLLFRVKTCIKGENEFEILHSFRFQALMTMLHFNNNENHIPRNQPGFDTLFKVRPVLNTVLLTCETVYSPEKNITVDEGTVG